MIKRFLQFNESVDNIKQTIDDMLLEYVDKYGLFSIESDSDEMDPSQRKDKNGFYRISDKIATTYFKFDGFPNDAKGYQVSLHIKSLQNEPQFKEDMLSFIKRVCKAFNFEYDTFLKEYNKSRSYGIAFYNKF
jgi:hypothetical protein